MPLEYIDRPPRIQPELPIKEVDIPQPPEQQAGSRQNIITLLLPLVTILAFAFASGSGNVGTSVLMGLVMSLAVVVAIFDGRRQGQELEKKKKLYSELLAAMRQDLVRDHNNQRIYYNHTYPDVPTLLDIAARTEKSRFGSRIWERRTSDSDFGAVRIGIGSRPSTVFYKYSANAGPLDEGPLSKDARRLSDDSKILTDAAITIPLRPFSKDQAAGEDPERQSAEPKAVAARHTLGIFGKNPGYTADFARALLASFTAFHSPHDTRLYVIGLPQNRGSWQWCEWMPHCIVRGIGEDDADLDKQKEFDQICFSPEKEKVLAFWKRLKKELDQRQVRLRDTEDSDPKKGGGVDVTLPMLLVVVDLLGDVPANHALADVASESVVATINGSGPTLGAAIIFLANDPAKIPSDCQAMIELASVGEQVSFRYTEVGLNTPRYIGVADAMTAADARQKFAARLRRLDLRRPLGADLPRSVDLLQMQSVIEGKRVATVDKLPIKANWEWSLKPENSEWLSAPIGMISLRDVRSLIFSAKEGGDGVHGMIAGTTGSGKSELLLTLIAGLAIKYDPRIVNFVLVDFKGGAAFEPFKKLPHVVDILTNLQANAVERMFVAVQAVMDKRSKLLADSNMKDLVDYRKKAPYTRNPALPKTFPHLFIIVDEFAEMITQNPDYKAKFESVTRLGRAFGVTLILATQRPAGVVSDQMRANMKFRICLRVETSDDSKELLSRPDAAFLANIGGRGYIQVGNDILQGIQVARAGGDYTDDRTEMLKDVVWLDDEPMPVQSSDAPLYAASELAEALGLKPGEKPGTLVDWVTGVCAIRARLDGVPPQKKPWPEALPEFLSLTEPIDAEYLNTERTLGPDKRTIINEQIKGWLENEEEKPLWPAFDWKQPTPLVAEIGIVDNPYLAEQRLLALDLAAAPTVVFGSPGKGKSYFIKSLLTALGASRTPNEVHMYAFDFGRGGLKAIKALPHVGAVIDASETARVDQMMRMLRNFCNERQDRLTNYNSLFDHNAKNPTQAFAEIVVVIDNFAEFKESYEHLIPDLMALIRDGRAFGMYFVITSASYADVSGKLYNLLTQRLTFTLPDRSYYSDIVGNGAPNFDSVPGRGLIAMSVKDHPMPLEFQVGLPGRPAPAGELDTVDEFQLLGQRMEKVWFALGGKRPSAELPRALTLLDMFALIDGRPVTNLGELNIAEKWKLSMQPEKQEWLRGAIGLVSSKEVKTMYFQAQADGVHGMAAGTTGSGKSELIQTLIAAMAIRYDPRIVNFVLVDYKGGPTVEPFRKLPHCVDIATNLDGNAVDRIFIAINAEMNRRSDILAKAGVSDLVEYRKKVIPGLKPGSPFPDTFPHLFIIVDEFGEMMTVNPEYRVKFESITRLGRSFGVSLILATQRPSGVVSDQMRANMKFRICLRVETPDDSKELLKKPDAARLPQIGGRGYFQAGTDLLTEVQAAWSGAPYDATKVADPVFSADEILTVLDKKSDPPRSLLGWLVGALAAEAKRQGIPKQFKPWPDPLPAVLPLNHLVDASYLPETSEDRVVIAPAVKQWVEASPTDDKANAALWQPWGWDKPLPLKVSFGIVDNPFLSNQRLLTIDIAGDPVIVFGASGRGKTTFLKSLMLTLGAQRSPQELHMYALDFGRGGLKAIRVLPHCGATVDASQPERVAQLFRMVRSIMNERQETLAKYASLEDYNAQHKDRPEALYPAVLFAIDNFAEFRESYEPLMGDLISMVRDGRAFGVYFVITASNPQDIPPKLYNLLTTRATFTLPDPSVYYEIVGRGALPLADVPGRGLIALEGRPLEFHVGVPVIEGEKDSFMALTQRMENAWFAIGGKRPAAEIPRAVTLLEMYQTMLARKVERIGDLDIAGNWKKSMKPENQEWLSAPIGLISSKEIRTMIFSAKAGGDGVHGMAAGTTGSGKSELIQTLISAMAIKYDPRIVNFVLVDYKGGPTVEPFRKLPHTVDVATNLDGNAVERIFIAINAEMNRRSDILAKAGVADLVDYRKKVIPTLKPDSPFPDTFPHLFIIVDEFAEMMMQNPDYKYKFESITRLGRSFGVSLILATQRPSGVVSDQMRANMKFRICLRVETSDDSKEMIGRPDAASLPAIGGRGYVQVGGGGLSEVQAAWSGAPYDENKPDPVYTVEEILAALEKQNDPPRTLLGWLVGALAAEAKRQGIPKQFKPWPDNLPATLPLNAPVNAEYIKEGNPEGVASLILNEPITEWIANTEEKAIWKPHHWLSPLPIDVNVGVADNPYRAEQRLLNLNLAADPAVVYGASGRGKTTFLKSLLISMAAKRSPNELHIFCLDFGRGGLRAVKALPHCGASIDASQPERVAQLFRMIKGIMNERQEKLQKFPSLEDYNARNADNPDAIFPAIVVAIDNFAEFKENYEPLLVDLISMVRDGRAFGIYYIITATMPQDVPPKLGNLLAQRFTFTLADASVYSDIVGRGAVSIENLPGRGLLSLDGFPMEFHAAVPVIEGEKDPFTKLAERMEKAWFAIGGKRPAAEIPRAVTLLEMYQTILGKKIDRIGELGIAENWQRSMKPENQEWLSAPIGLVSSKEIRTMIFSAKAGGDGVHGMAAGTTGSGKSELIQTLISAMAIKYDPRIVNFVLVDYKGGPTVEPFRKLPHSVDIATNLDGNAVERIFIAINAEMNRRSDILAKAGVADLVDYRKKVIPTLKPDSPFPNTFPHLFIIVDEFAEMMMQTPEYKYKFESITRLGRSFGVSLILATQRPSGVVSDQMRANMKFRICLRVETADDSREMIGRGDAATLPAIGGRGYVQVGGGQLTEVQAAWSGAPYDETKPDPVYPVNEILDAIEKQTDPPRSLLGWLVGALALEAKRQKIPKQFKPWPDPLPATLPLNRPFDASYMAGAKLGDTVIINPDIAEWMNNTDAKPLWKPVDWKQPIILKAPIGIVDNPYAAQQRVLDLNLSNDPLVVFGASGRGKSTFLKTLVISLAARFSPVELHVFVLDFGRGGLKALKALPHVGGVVDSNEEERVERLIRMVRMTIDERQTKLAAYDSLADYNAKNPESAFPTVLVVVDNVTEFKEAYERFLPELIALVRDGRSFGVYFVVTGSLQVDVPMKLFNLLTQRITFYQADYNEYSTIMGRGWTRFPDVPGRGLTAEIVGEAPIPLEFHTGVPVGEADTDYVRELAGRMAKAWETLEAKVPQLKAKRPKPVEPLAVLVDIASVLPAELGAGAPAKAAPIGINDLHRDPTVIEFKNKGPHLMVIGPPVTGKSTMIRSMVLALAHLYSPEQAAFVFVDPSDPSRQFYNYGPTEENTLDKLPHVLATVSNAREFDAMVKRLKAEFDEEVVGRLKTRPDVFTPLDNRTRSIFVIIDHYDDADAEFNKIGEGMAGLAQVGKGKNLHFVICGTTGITRASGDDLRRRVEGARYTLVMNDFEVVRYMGVRAYFTVNKELPPGRGFLVKAVSASLVQAAAPVLEGKNGLSAEQQLNDMFNRLKAHYPNRARWSYFNADLGVLEAAIKGEDLTNVSATGEQAAAAAPAQSPEASEAMAALAELMKMQSSMTQEFLTTQISDADPSQMVSLELPDEPEAGGNGKEAQAEPEAAGAGKKGKKK